MTVPLVLAFSASCSTKPTLAPRPAVSAGSMAARVTAGADPAAEAGPAPVTTTPRPTAAAVAAAAHRGGPADHRDKGPVLRDIDDSILSGGGGRPRRSTAGRRHEDEGEVTLGPSLLAPQGPAKYLRNDNDGTVVGLSLCCTKLPSSLRRPGMEKRRDPLPDPAAAVRLGLPLLRDVDHPLDAELVDALAELVA